MEYTLAQGNRRETGTWVQVTRGGRGGCGGKMGKSLAKREEGRRCYT